MKNLNFWTYIIEKEFDEFKSELTQLLQINNLIHDRENYWEYMEGYSQKFKVRVNISRPHKQHMDLPQNEIPLHIIFYACSDNYTAQIGNELNELFKLPIYYGSYTDNSTSEKRDYIFKPQKSFKRLDLTNIIKAHNTY